MKFPLCVTRTALAAGCLAVAASLAGCGSGSKYERVAVSGKVTHQGQPVEYGQIRLLPSGETKTPMAAAYISNGQYVIDAKGGAAVGTYKVEITAFRFKGRGRPAGNSGSPGEDLGGGGAREQYLPEKYNSKTELNLTVEPNNATITKDFDL